MLHSCIQSVIRTRKPENCRVDLVIIDNNEEATAQKTIAALSEKSPYEIHYLHEPRRGIPIGRNRALRFAQSNKADFLVFIDDDETVEKNWLSELYRYAMKKNGRAVIHGRVIPQCPPRTPGHIVPFFEGRRHKPTGTPLMSCATDNVLIPVHPVTTHKLVFNESRPLAGGTDIQFFNRCGMEIFSCSEAVVYETVTRERTRIGWLVRRKFRTGIDNGKRKKENENAVRIVFSAVLQILFRLPLSALLLIAGKKHRAVHVFLRACRSAGTILGMFGITIDSYKSIDGQ
jgi:succinoglycan biosynthesis protein ExoM